MRFDKKVVIVTGSGAGIGRAAAVQFGEEGAKVVVNSTRPATGEETLSLVRKTGAEAIFVQADISKEEDCDRLIDETLQAFGRIDVLVNNAGVVLGGTIDDTKLDDFERTMDVNVKGTFMMMQKAVAVMKKQGGGSIVNTASIAGTRGLRNRLAYCASKAAVIGLTKAAAADLVRDNIRVNAVSPGTTLTPSLEDRIATAPDPEKMKQEFFDRQPIGRLGYPEEIARAILFAADEGVGFMDGVNIQIDGGMAI
ncbi:MAG: SDR family oxidoreductase [Lachnospiraceae bacterium]|nr:SDR family oxidoreductase [Lachnospiraceae bacterium]